MCKLLTIRNMTLGDGIPKICIPLTDNSLNRLNASIDALESVPFDFVEWRADFYRGFEDADARREVLALLRDKLSDTLVLFTIRSVPEMGTADLDTSLYTDICLSVIESGLADLIDVELSRGRQTMNILVSAAHRAGMKVIASRHDPLATPDKSVIVDTLCTMQDLGADIVKFAVMPQCEHDVLTLLDATLTMKKEHCKTPFITMSMSRLGAVSRICGSVFGSSVTFGASGMQSAPGQLPAGILAEVLKYL